MPLPYRERRARLEEFFDRLALRPPWTLCPSTTSRSLAQQWSQQWAPLGIEGIVAKSLTERYLPGARRWRKWRWRHSTEAIVGAVTGPFARPQTLLLGRLDPRGRLRYVARTVPLPPAAARQVAAELVPAGAGHPWSGRAFTAGWHSREPLHPTLVSPRLVAEIAADTAVDAGIWRHPVRLLRLRADLSPDDVPASALATRPPPAELRDPARAESPRRAPGAHRAVSARGGASVP